MTEFITDIKDNGKTLENAITRRFGYNAKNKLYKALRNRDVKIDGKRTSQNEILTSGLNIAIYVDFERQKAEYNIVFQNDNFLVAEKKQGVTVNEDINGEVTLIETVKRDVSFNCELCHRLDRNTGGLILISKNNDARVILTEMLDSSKDKEIIKYYTALVSGKINPSKSPIHLDNYLFKDNKKSHVYIYDTPVKGAVPCFLEYTSITYYERSDYSKLRIRLLTGRTHQIRAQFAHIGHPVLGDGKYGREETNKKFKFRFQALWASELLVPLNDKLFSKEETDKDNKTEKIEISGKMYARFTSVPDFR